MGTYVLIYTGGDQPTSPAEGEAAMQQWMAWFHSLGDVVIDGGNPFDASASIAPTGAVTPGTSSGVSGYTIIRADDLDSATELAKGCPHLKANGTVEIHQTYDVM